MNFIFEQIRTGGDRNFAYLVGDRKAKVAAAIDPSYEPRRTYDRATAQGLTITHVLITHGHVDHVSGNDLLKAAVGGEVLIHELDGLKLMDPARNASRMFGFDVRVRPADRLVREGETIAVGKVRLRVLHTPGHSAGEIALLGDGFVFTGDTTSRARSAAATFRAVATRAPSPTTCSSTRSGGSS